MVTHTGLFSDTWLNDATNAPEESWALDVARDLNTNGQRYLDWIKCHYEYFVGIDRSTLHLRKRLESIKTEDHLGGINELVSFSYMRKLGLQVRPLETTNRPRPDFRIVGGDDFFVEVSTLNVSDEDRIALTKLAGASLKQDRTIERVFVKLNKKKEQFEYGENQSKPTALFLFDYSAHSGYGVQTAQAIDIALNREDCAYFSFPRSLSALVFFTKCVIDGRPVIRKSKTAIFHNPLASIELVLDPFHDIGQYEHGAVIEPGVEDAIHIGDES